MLIGRCLVCGSLTDGNGPVCENCLSLIHKDYIDNYLTRCPFCHHPILDGLYVCPSCKGKGGLEVYSITDWNSSFSRDIIAAFKFRGHKELAKVVALVLKEYLGKIATESSVIVPVPASDKGISKRGYDHMKLVAQLLPYKTEYLLKNTNRDDEVEQKKLNRNMRISHSKGRYSVNKTKLSKDTPLIIIDDIVTTGSTVRSAGEALKTAGFKNIKVLSWFTVIKD